MRKYLIACFAMLLAAGQSLYPLTQVRAETKTVAAVALKSYDDLVGTVKYFGDLADRPELSGALEGVISIGTQGKGLAGIDKSRPIGVVLQAEGNDVTGYAFVPLKSEKALIGLLDLFTTSEKELEGYKFTPKDGKEPFYGKIHGNWAVFSNKIEGLASVIDDPSSLVSDVSKQYLIGGKLFLANIPEGHRNKLLANITEGMKHDLASKSGESSEVHAARMAASKNAMASIKLLVDGLNQVSFGWGVDRASDKLVAEVNVTAKEGSPLADQMASLEKTSSKLSALAIDDQAAAMHASAPITELKAGVLNSFITLIRQQGLAETVKGPADKQELAKSLINNGADLAEKIVKGGRFDMAASVTMQPDNFVGVIGAYVADGALLDKILHTVYDAINNENPVIGQLVKFDADKVASVSLHTITIPLGPETENREKVVKMVGGEQLQIVIGIGSDTAYISAGKEALETIKKSITATVAAGEKAVAPIDFSISTEKVASFMAVNGKDDSREKAAKLDAELQKSPGKDHITLMAKSVPQGVQYRLEIEKGLLQAVGKVAGPQDN